MDEPIVLEIFDDITSETFKNILHSTTDLPDGTNIELLISSYGGEILPTISIIETLNRFHTKANIIGFACSSAAILAISCDECVMGETSSMLLHSAWNDVSDADDPGIKRCNELQLSIISKRCPDFDSKDIRNENWLSAQDCLEMNLADNIYINDNVDYVALCKKYAAKLSSKFYNKEIIMPEEQINEVVEEVKEEVQEKEPEMPEDHDLIEVIEKLTEEMNALKARVMALEELSNDSEKMKEEKEEVEEIKEEEVNAACEDGEKERINNLYKSIIAPQARVAIGTPKCAAQKVVHKVDYKSFGQFING